MNEYASLSLHEGALFWGASFDDELYPDDAGYYADAGDNSNYEYLPTEEIPEEFSEKINCLDDDRIATFGDDFDFHGCGMSYAAGGWGDDGNDLIEVIKGREEDTPSVVVGLRQRGTSRLHTGDDLPHVHTRTFYDRNGIRYRRTVVNDSHGYRGRNQKGMPKKRDRLSIRHPSCFV